MCDLIYEITPFYLYIESSTPIHGHTSSSPILDSLALNNFLPILKKFCPQSNCNIPEGCFPNSCNHEYIFHLGNRGGAGKVIFYVILCSGLYYLIYITTHSTSKLWTVQLTLKYLNISSKIFKYFKENFSLNFAVLSLGIQLCEHGLD